MDLVIRTLRERKNLGLRELASMAGIAANTLSLIETGKNKHPTTRTLEKIANALECKVTDLFGRIEICRD
jgi:DNA-binding Xre family transcriptional regulator